MRIVELTDLHFGHPKIDLKKFVSCLHEYAYPEILKSNLLLICGDFFDGLLNINGDAGVTALYVIDELLSMVVKNNIYLRILRGTFSHDRYQNRLFVERASTIPLIDDVPLIRVLDKIEVERIPTLGIDLLYCPDDQPNKDVTESIIDILDANHLNQVDYMCSHGYWDHLLPSSLLIKPHNCLDYSKLKDKVRYHIFNGHVHTPGIWNDKIISGGSFERFVHGEEEDKGFYIVDFDKKKKTSHAKFIRNKRSTPFISVDLSIENTYEKALGYLDDQVKQALKYYPSLDETIYIRIIGDGSAIIPEIRNRYTKAIITEKSISTSNKTMVDFGNSISDLPILTVDNLPTLIHENTKEKYPELTLNRIKEILHANGE